MQIDVVIKQKMEFKIGDTAIVIRSKKIGKVTVVNESYPDPYYTVATDTGTCTYWQYELKKETELTV